MISLKKINLINIIENNSPEKCMDIFFRHFNNKQIAFDKYKVNAIYSVKYSEKKYGNNINEFNKKVVKNIDRAYEYLK